MARGERVPAQEDNDPTDIRDLSRFNFVKAEVLGEGEEELLSARPSAARGGDQAPPGQRPGSVVPRPAGRATPARRLAIVAVLMRRAEQLCPRAPRVLPPAPGSKDGEFFSFCFDLFLLLAFSFVGGGDRREEIKTRHWRRKAAENNLVLFCFATSLLRGVLEEPASFLACLPVTPGCAPEGGRRRTHEREREREMHLR